MEQKTLAELTGQNINIAFADAVAIAQQLICEADVLCGAQPPFGPLTQESLAITDEGTVRCLHTASTPTVMEVALLMQSMLGRSQSLPGGLRYTISRAIHEVEAPPFESVGDFSRALERFEAGDRREQVASLYERARAGSARSADAVTVPSEADVSACPERRVRQQSATALRRQLREADQRFYEAHCQSSHAAQKAGKGHSRRAPIAACMIAGVALVAAGEIVHVQQPSRLVDATQAPPAETGMATSSFAEAVPQSAVTTTPLNASVRSSRSTAGPSAARRQTKARANGLTTQGRTTANKTAWKAAPHSPRKAVEDGSKQQHVKPRPERDKSDHGLLRIRFVWNNPFH